MVFPSRYATLIWDRLYLVNVPDVLTQNPEYIKRFGVRITGNKDIDKDTALRPTTVMIPIINILDYFLEGVQVSIPNRKDMIEIHKSIENYLQEWREHITYSINTSHEEYKELIISLEKLSKYIYDRSTYMESVDNKLKQIKLGMVNRYVEMEQNNNIVDKPKPNYNGINQLIKDREVKTRFGNT